MTTPIYYISAAGNDSHNGTSTGTSWATSSEMIYGWFLVDTTASPPVLKMCAPFGTPISVAALYAASESLYVTVGANDFCS